MNDGRLDPCSMVYSVIVWTSKAVAIDTTLRLDYEYPVRCFKSLWDIYLIGYACI